MSVYNAYRSTVTPASNGAVSLTVRGAVPTDARCVGRDRAAPRPRARQRRRVCRLSAAPSSRRAAAPARARGRPRGTRSCSSRTSSFSARTPPRIRAQPRAPRASRAPSGAQRAGRDRRRGSRAESAEPRRQRTSASRTRRSACARCSSASTRSSSRTRRRCSAAARRSPGRWTTTITQLGQEFESDDVPDRARELRRSVGAGRTAQRHRQDRHGVLAARQQHVRGEHARLRGELRLLPVDAGAVEQPRRVPLRRRADEHRAAGISTPARAIRGCGRSGRRSSTR